MNVTAIIIAAAVIAATGIIVGIGLGLFGEKFKVEVDEKNRRSGKNFREITAADAVLPGVMPWQRPLRQGKLPPMPVL